MINTKDLDLVRAIADTGSLTAAGQHLHISQSAVSQRLSHLQARLELKLLERKNGAMQLTPAGKRVYQASNVVGDEVTAMLSDLADMTASANAQLRIAAQCYTTYRWLPFVIARMRSQHARLHVDVVPTATDSPFEALREGDIDVAIVSRSNNDAEFDEHSLFSDEFYAVMSSQHALAEYDFLQAADFRDQTLVLYTGAKHAIIEEVLKPARIRPGNVIQVRITEAILELARAGHGIAIIAGWALDDIGQMDGLTAVRIGEHGFKRHWRAAFRSNYSPALADSFTQCLRETGAAIERKDWRKHMQAKV